MATGSPPDVARVVVDLAASRAPTCGSTRVVCVDGPAGSGKTTLAAEIAALTGAQVIHGDDLMEGWRGLDAVGEQLVTVLADLAVGRPSNHRRYDWVHDRYAARAVDVPVAPWLVLEGVGTGTPAVAGRATVLVWVEADHELRFRRGLERDGSQMEQHWRQFMADEAAVFERDRTRDRADVVVDGTGASPPRVSA